MGHKLRFSHHPGPGDHESIPVQLTETKLQFKHQALKLDSDAPSRGRDPVHKRRVQQAEIISAGRSNSHVLPGLKDCSNLLGRKQTT